MSTNNKSIHILRGRTSSTSTPNVVDNTLLEAGQPFYDKRTNTLRIGDGTNAIKNVKPVTVADGAITDVKVADNAAIKGSKLADASNDESNPTGITTEKIENSAVTSGKLKRTDVYVMHQLLCEDNDTNRDARYAASSLQFVDHNKKYKPGAGSKFVSSRLSLMPNETVAGGFTLKMPWVSGTLATKEQVENGEIIAQTSQNATNATYAQKTDFSNAEWITHESNTDKVSVNYGESYEIIGYNGRFDDDYSINDFAPTVITIPPASMWNETRGQGFILGSTISSLMSEPDIIRVEESTILIDRDLKMSCGIYLKKYDTTTHRWVAHEWISQNSKFSYRRIR